MTKHQTCAACKFQRKKCTDDCSMAPYFPANKSKQFLNAHKLFGVSKLAKTLDALSPHLRPTAMSAMCAEADHRAKDPVGGCYSVVLSLLGLISQCEVELQRVRARLFVLRRGGESTVVAQDLDEYRYNVVLEHGFDPVFEESNVFGLRSAECNLSKYCPLNNYYLDEVVLHQDLNPIKDEGKEELEAK